MKYSNTVNSIFVINAEIRENANINNKKLNSLKHCVEAKSHVQNCKNHVVT